MAARNNAPGMTYTGASFSPRRLERVGHGHYDKGVILDAAAHLDSRSDNLIPRGTYIAKHVDYSAYIVFDKAELANHDLQTVKITEHDVEDASLGNQQVNAYVTGVFDLDVEIYNNGGDLDDSDRESFSQRLIVLR